MVVEVGVAGRMHKVLVAAPVVVILVVRAVAAQVAFLESKGLEPVFTP
jgi:hypothetical protein